VGGVVLSVTALSLNVAAGLDRWVTLKTAGLPFLGDRAVEPGPDTLAVVVGLATHFAISIGWGATFALLFYGVRPWLTLLSGGLWGLVVWLGMYGLVLPAIGLGVLPRQTPVASAVIQHVVFGLSLAGALLPFQKSARADRAETRRPHGPFSARAAH